MVVGRVRFPDDVVIDYPRLEDEYGNPGSDSDGATSSASKGFLVPDTLLLLPAGAVIPDRDGVTVRGRLYSVDEVSEVRSPAATKLWTATVRRLP